MHEQRVRTGRRVGDRIEIVDGIASGDVVITEPGGLSHGAAVRVARVRPPMRALAATCIQRPVFAAMLILALVVVGASAFFRLASIASLASIFPM